MYSYFDYASCIVDVVDVLGGRRVANEDTIGGPVISLRRFGTWFSNVYSTTKGAKVGNIWFGARDGLIRGHLDERVREPILDVYRVNQCKAPILRS